MKSSAVKEKQAQVHRLIEEVGQKITEKITEKSGSYKVVRVK